MGIYVDNVVSMEEEGWYLATFEILMILKPGFAWHVYNDSLNWCRIFIFSGVFGAHFLLIRLQLRYILTPSCFVFSNPSRTCKQYNGASMGTSL